VSSCLCQTNSPCTLTMRTSWSLIVATIFGCQCSCTSASFSARLTYSDMYLLWCVTAVECRTLCLACEPTRTFGGFGFSFGGIGRHDVVPSEWVALHRVCDDSLR